MGSNDDGADIIDDEEELAVNRNSRKKNNRLTRLKRPSITSTPMDITSSFSFQPPSYLKSTETINFLLTAMGDNFVFDSIDHETKLQFVNAMQSQEYCMGDWVMCQGDVGDYFYIIEDGEVAFHVRDGSDEEGPTETSEKGTQVGTASKGSTFGELALLYNTPRAASIRAISSVLKVYKIDQCTFRSLLMSQQAQDHNNISSLVRKVSVFKDLDEVRVQKLVDAFTVVEYARGERIVNKGDQGNVFYIVKSGQVKIDDIGHGSSKFQDHILKEGECFGERALITGETRAANVTASDDVASTTLLAISKGTLEEILGPLEQAVMHSSHAKYLSSIPLFEYLEPDEIDRCVKYLREETFGMGETIVDTKGKLYLIQEGHALMMIHGETKKEQRSGGSSNGENKLVKLEKGDYFGDLWGGYNQEVNDAPQDKPDEDQSDDKDSITVEKDMKCLTLLTSDIQTVIGDLKRVSTFAFDLSSIEEDDGNIGRSNGTKNPSRMSRIKYTSTKKSSFDYIKEKKSTTNRNVLNLSKLKKHRILGVGTFGKVCVVPGLCFGACSFFVSCLCHKSFSHAHPMHLILTQNFLLSPKKNKVWLVTPKSNDKGKPTPYALKMISKRQILQQKLAPAVLREKNVMESIQHPFLLHMVSAFQDENYLYFVLNLILGGELFEIIYADGAKKKTMNDNPVWKESAFYKSFGTTDDKPMEGVNGVGVRKALFYGAGVIEAFNYLHNRRIVYRDLKPENIMINSLGYCVVVDMGFAKVVLDKTYTVCGTLEYLAPEVIANKGHNHNADYWSFACLLYGLIVGQTPFFEAGLDQMSLLKKIVKANYTFPAMIDELSPGSSNGLEKALCYWKDLISRLLKPRAVERLGNLRNGIEDILNHDWFAIDFAEFRNQSIPAPWIPTIVDPLDTSHFGTNFGREEQPEKFRRKLSDKDQEVFRGF